MAPRIPLVALLLSLTVAPLLRAEFPVGEPGIAPTLDQKSGAVIAATPSGFLAAWSPRTRRGDYGRPMVALLSRSGQLIGLPFQNGLPDGSSFTSAATNDEEVMLAGFCPGERGTVCVARLDPSGALRELTTLAAGADQVEIVSNGRDFLAAYTRAESGTWSLYAVPIARGGAVAASVFIGSVNYLPQVTSAGTRFFALLGDRRAPVLAEISARGIEASRAIPLPFDAGADISISGSGERVLVAVPDLGTPGRFVARTYRGIDAVTDWAPAVGRGNDLTVVPTRSGWLVASSNTAEIALTPVGQGGAPGPSSVLPNLTYDFVIGSPVRGATGDSGIAIAFNSSSTEVVEVDRGGRPILVPILGRADVRVAIVGDDGAPIAAPRTISMGPAPQIEPSAFWNVTEGLVAWSELRSDGQWGVRAQALNYVGTAVGPSVSVPFGGRDQRGAVVASDGASFLVVWAEAAGTEILAARVDREGRLLDAEPIHLFGPLPAEYWFRGDFWRTADVAWNGSAWIVVVTDESRRLVAKRVSPSGVVLDEVPVAIEGGASAYRVAPKLSCAVDGTCLVVWHTKEVQSTWPYLTLSPTVWASRVASDLTALDARPAQLENHLLMNPWRTRVTWNETAGEWAVLWSTGDGRRVGRDGVVLGRATRDWDEIEVAAAPEADGWRLAWSTPAGDVFHGWSRTGTIDGIRDRWRLSASDDWEWGPELMAAPRPIAIFVREPAIAPGSPRLVGAIVSEMDREETTLTLQASRIGERNVLLSWSTSIDRITSFELQQLSSGRWLTFGAIPGSERSTQISLGAGHAARFRIVAVAGAGRVASNVVSFTGERGRTAAR